MLLIDNVKPTGTGMIWCCESLVVLSDSVISLKQTLVLFFTYVCRIVTLKLFYWYDEPAYYGSFWAKFSVFWQ